MNEQINISNIGLFFQPSKRNMDNSKEKEKERTVVVRQSFLSNNEATICHKLRKMLYYHHYFALLEDYEVLNVHINEDEDEEEVNKIQLKNEYFIFKYNDKNALDFTDILYNSCSIKKYIFSLFNIFQYLLKGLQILHNQNICFFNIHPQNILFLTETPVFSNFKHSLQIPKLLNTGYTYLHDIMMDIEEYTYLPFEINILYWIMKNPHIKSLDKNIIHHLCDEYIKNMYILQYFSAVFKNNYHKLCIEMLTIYENKDINYIVKDIIERNAKWDIFGLSLLYIHIFGCIIRVYSLTNTFFNKILTKLLVNLHPDSSKRYSISETADIFNKYLNDNEDWTFVNQLKNEKMDELLKEMSK